LLEERKKQKVKGGDLRATRIARKPFQKKVPNPPRKKREKGPFLGERGEKKRAPTTYRGGISGTSLERV